MESYEQTFDSKLPFPVPGYRFDQKSEVFKRGAWDEKIKPYARAMSAEVVYKEKAGYTQALSS